MNSLPDGTKVVVKNPVAKEFFLKTNEVYTTELSITGKHYWLIDKDGSSHGFFLREELEVIS